MVGRIVQVGDSCDRLLAIAQPREKVEQVFAIAGDLNERMQNRVVSIGIHENQARVFLEGLSTMPLHQLDDDIGRETSSRVPAGKHGIDPLAGEW